MSEMQRRHALSGLHHITLVAGNAQRTADFYVRLLGQRLVKKTVNFDRPDSYHLYFGDEVGSAGTLVTFFEWPQAPTGQTGIGAVHHLALGVNSYDALLKWKTWLQHAGVLVAGPYDHRAYRNIIFTDPDGIVIEITTCGPGWQATLDGSEVFTPPPETMAPYRDEAHIAAEKWPHPVTEISRDMRLRGLHHVTAVSGDLSRTDDFYQRVLGIPLVRKSTDIFDSEVPHWYWGLEGGEPGTLITYFTTAHAGVNVPPLRGSVGRGLTHHVALGVENDEALQSWRERLLEHGLEVTPVRDRKYFHSIYFRDPDGLLLEVATSRPGFLVDEERDQLGRHLTLPDWLEERRGEIEASLPPLRTPEPASTVAE